METRRTTRAVLLLLTLVLAVGLAGCELISNLVTPGGGDPVPLEVFLVIRGQRVVSAREHPVDALGGLPVGVWASEACYIDWGDGSPVSELLAAGETPHLYLRQGEYDIRCWTDPDGGGWREATLSLDVTNMNPVIGRYFCSDPTLSWRQNLSVWLNAHVGGCNGATGEYLYDWGMMDPDGDETRVRWNVDLVQEILVDGAVVRYEFVESWTVFSGHDRSVISNKWADVWAIWLQVGYAGALAPFPFLTVPYDSLVPEYRDESVWGELGIKDWGGPDWPDCGDCDDPEEPDPDPEPDPEEERGACLMRVKQEVMDRWGGYKHQIWFIPLNGCTAGCQTAPPALPPVVGPGIPCGQ